MSEVAIQAQNLSKQFKIGLAQEFHDTLRDQISHGFRSLFRRNGNTHRAEDMFWALKDVSFEVPRGEVVGVIGRNGSGKSTLLKILSRITEPTEGRAKTVGRVASLLEVGTGFHHELTGRENVYLNGAILGMKKAEINRKFDEIVSFSEIEKFIDTPVKRYSSGMYVRLAFAVAAHLEPEILIIDEVLAVGDAGFQKKCLGKMEGVGQEGRTVIFVSHNMAAVEHLCNKVYLLEQGKLIFAGNPKEATDHYLAGFPSENHASDLGTVDLTISSGRSRKRRPLLERLELFTEHGKLLSGGLKIGAPLKAFVHFRLENPTAQFNVALGFDNQLGQRVFTASSEFEPDRPESILCGSQTLVCSIPSLTLVPGEYKIKVGLSIGNSTADTVEDAMRFTVQPSDYYGTGKVPWNGTFVLEQHWHLE